MDGYKNMEGAVLFPILQYTSMCVKISHEEDWGIITVASTSHMFQFKNAFVKKTMMLGEYWRSAGEL